MTQERTYTIIQRDHHGEPVNTMTGLDELAANILAAVLRTGDAYTGERPWSCEVVPEPSREERIAAVVDEWLVSGEALTRADHLVACLRRVADVLEPLGDKVIPRAGLKVELHLFTHGGGAAERMAALDELAGLFGRRGGMNEQVGHYHTGYLYGGGLRLVTIADEEAATEAVAAQGNPVAPVAPERVDALLAELNRLTDAEETIWWEWLNKQPELDAEATAAAPTAEVHLTDGTVLVWRRAPDMWRRSTDWPVP